MHVTELLHPLPFNPLTTELPEHGVPDLELPDTTLFSTVFWKFPSRYFVFMGIHQGPPSRHFSLTGICNGRRSRFFGLAG